MEPHTSNKATMLKVLRICDRICENVPRCAHFRKIFLAFYNSVVQGDYNALCFMSVPCSVAKLQAPPFPCSAEERLE